MIVLAGQSYAGRRGRVLAGQRPAVAALAIVLFSSCGASSLPQDPLPSPAPVAGLEPSGAIPQPPLRYTFPEHPDARVYHLTIRDGAGRQIAAVDGPRSPLFLHDSLGELFSKGEPYSWSVEMEGEGGRPLGTGAGATFTLIPPP